MAFQRLFIATIAGDAATVILSRFQSWRTKLPTPVGEPVDHFCISLRDNATSLPILYLSEWIDRWLMGDQIPGPGMVEGNRFQATCFSRSDAMEWADRVGSQHQEQTWLAARLREAASAWKELADHAIVVVVREVIKESTRNEDVLNSLQSVPEWLLNKSL